SLATLSRYRREGQATAQTDETPAGEMTAEGAVDETQVEGVELSQHLAAAGIRQELSTTVSHRAMLKAIDADVTADGEAGPAADAPAAAPEPPPPPTPVPTAQLVSDCAICAMDLVVRRNISRAVLGSPAPDIPRIAAAFECDPAAVQYHWAH